MQKQAKIWALTLFMAAVSSQGAVAAQRTVYFTQTARNTTTEYPLREAVFSHCRLTVSNPSTTSQNITISMNVHSPTASSSGAWSATGAGNASVPSGFSGSNPGSITTSLAAGASATYEFRYPAFPANQAWRFQQLICAGSIVATDPTDSTPGYLTAGGTLSTFNSTGALQTDGAPMGTTMYHGMAIFTQVPVAVNRGRPF